MKCTVISPACQLFFVADNEKTKLPAFVALVKDSHEHKNKTYYNTDLQYAEYKPFFWGKAAKYGEFCFYKENNVWLYRFISHLGPFFKSSSYCGHLGNPPYPRYITGYSSNFYKLF